MLPWQGAPPPAAYGTLGRISSSQSVALPRLHDLLYLQGTDGHRGLPQCSPYPANTGPCPSPRLSPKLLSGSESSSSHAHRDERFPPVLFFQGAQLRRGQQSQSQLLHHWGRYLGHRPLQHRLRTTALSPDGREHLALRPLAGCLRPKAPSAAFPLARLTALTHAQFRTARTSSASSTPSLSLRSRSSNAGADSSRKPRVRSASCGSEEWVREEQNETCGVGSMKIGSCTWLWVSMKAMQHSCNGPRPKVTAT